MIFPPLNRTDRDREYKTYSTLIRANVVYSYLFSGLSHRSLDKEIIGLDSEKTKGWQSMGILHFLGLRNEHKAFFKKQTINEVIQHLKKLEDSNLSLIIEYLEYYKYANKKMVDAEKFETDFQRSVTNSINSTSEERQERLKQVKNTIPETTEVISKVFKRNSDVIAEVLKRANGLCEYCGKEAPFLRAKDNTPYLEVHHKIRLADGGEDTVDNAVALCPNCHRETHFGITNNA